MVNPRAAQLVEAGMWLRLSGDHEGAKRLFQQALNLDPDNARARQLLDSQRTPPAASAPAPPARAPSNPFVPAATSTAMDVDWGNATGFAPTPVPITAPEDVRQAIGDAKEDFELPIELNVESMAPFANPSPPNTLEFDGLSELLPPAVKTKRGPRPEESSEPPPFEDNADPTEEVSWEDELTPHTFIAPIDLSALPTAPTGGFRTIQPVDALIVDDWDELLATPVAVFSVPPAPPSQPRPPAPSEPKFAPNATSAWDQRSNPGIKLNEAEPGFGAALDLVAADRLRDSTQVSKSDEVRALVQGVKDLLGLDDHTGAMDLILKAQELAPNDPEVQQLRARSENTLEAMFESKLGKLATAPRVKLKDDEIIWLNLDHRAGFVLAQIDGSVTFEDLFSVSGMSRLDTARILAQLVEEGVITR